MNDENATKEPNRFYCDECVTNVVVDEDACCKWCGADTRPIYDPKADTEEGALEDLEYIARAIATMGWTTQRGSYLSQSLKHLDSIRSACPRCKAIDAGRTGGLCVTCQGVAMRTDVHGDE